MTTGIANNSGPVALLIEEFPLAKPLAVNGLACRLQVPIRPFLLDLFDDSMLVPIGPELSIYQADPGVQPKTTAIVCVSQA